MVHAVDKVVGTRRAPSSAWQKAADVLGLGQRVVLAVDVGVEALVRLAGCISGGSIFSLMVWWLLC